MKKVAKSQPGSYVASLHRRPGYYREFREIEKDARDELAGGRRHLHEARLKEERRTHGRPGHEVS